MAKRQRAPQPFDPVIITWEDAYVDTTRQHSSPTEALAAYKPVVRKSIGFWIGRTDAVVMFATDDDRTSEEPNALAGIAQIPVGMVKSVKIVGIG